jgi:hypothetical protein
MHLLGKEKHVGSNPSMGSKMEDVRLVEDAVLKTVGLFICFGGSSPSSSAKIRITTTHLVWGLVVQIHAHRKVRVNITQLWVLRFDSSS